MADLLKAELLAHASDAILEFEKRGFKAEAWFKATCPLCGARVQFNEPNVIFDDVECCHCGIVFPFEKGGYLVAIHMR
jgi:hypothetical protein